MPVELDRLIVPVNGSSEGLRFYTDLLGFLDDRVRPPFTVVRVSDRHTLRLAPSGTDGHMHLAFAVTP